MYCVKVSTNWHRTFSTAQLIALPQTSLTLTLAKKRRWKDNGQALSVFQAKLKIGDVSS